MKLFPSAVVLCALGSVAQADIVQFDITTDVVQEFWYQWADPNVFVDDQPVFYPEYIQAVNEAGIWDQAQVAAINQFNTPTYISSTGVLDAVWSFDTGVLDQDLTVFTGVPSQLGSANLASTFNVTRNGATVATAVTARTDIFVLNNAAVDATQLDIVGIRAFLPNNDPLIEDGDGIMLLISGGANWFETARDSGQALDLTDLVAAEVFYGEYHQRPENPAWGYYDIEITGNPLDGSMILRNFGAGDGSAEDAPLLPQNLQLDGAAPVFEFDVSGAVENQFIFVDPEVAVGYTYTVEDAQIAAIKAPTLAAVNDVDGYVVTLPNGDQFTLLPGEELDLSLAPVSSFVLTGINPALGIEPTDQTTFVLGLQLTALGQSPNLTQEVIVFDTDATPAVPLPAGMVLMLSGIAGLGVAARRRRAA